jgi:glyoxylase-like metal-dependent hydrolase (beta-lactamase superfamily II)
LILAKRSARGLEAIGRDPAHIDLVVNPHFHFDHVGGREIPGQRAEGV